MLTSEQKKLFELFKKFVAQNEERCFILQGHAGTGKTFMIGLFANYLKEQMMPFKLMASTGRAARILSQRTSFAANTIHKVIYNLNNIEETVEGSLRFHYKLNTPENDNVIYIIDESSMISDVESAGEVIRFGSGRLLSDIFEFAGIKEISNHSKVIFVGDPHQLPPVDMNTSPALDKNYLLNEHNVNAFLFNLSCIVRQVEANHIIDVAQAIQRNIAERCFNELIIKPAEGQIEEVTREHIKELWRQNYHCDEGKLHPEIFCITYTNKTALSYNITARSAIFGGNGDEPARQGDYIMVIANNRKTGLLNGDIARIMDIAPHSISRRIRVYSKGKPLYVDLSFRAVNIAFQNIDGTITETSCNILENSLFSPYRSISIEEQKALFIGFCIRNNGIKPTDEEFVSLLMEDEYYNALQVKFAYAATCHKAQGNEWDNVIIVFEHSKPSEQSLRWAYTSLTRAKKRVLGINLPYFVQWDGLITQFKKECQNTPILSESTTLLPPSKNETIPIPLNFTDKFTALLQDAPIKIIEEHKLLGYKLSHLGIEVCKVNPYLEKYYIRYYLKKNTKNITLDLYFNKKLQTKILLLPFNGSQKELANEIQNISLPPTDRKVTLDHAPNNNCTKQFYERLIMPKCREHNITVSNIEHLPYRERYTFQFNGKQIKADFIYNARGEFTSYAGDTQNLHFRHLMTLFFS